MYPDPPPPKSSSTSASAPTSAAANVPDSSSTVTPTTTHLSGAAVADFRPTTYAGGPKYAGHTLAQWETDKSLERKPHAGHGWTKEAVDFVVYHRALGVSYERIARVLGRTPLSLRLKKFKGKKARAVVDRRSRVQNNISPTSAGDPFARDLMSAQTPSHLRGLLVSRPALRPTQGTSAIRDAVLSYAEAQHSYLLGLANGSQSTDRPRPASPPAAPEDRRLPSSTRYSMEESEVASQLHTLMASEMTSSMSNGTEKKCPCVSDENFVINHHGNVAGCEAYRENERKRKQSK